MKKFDDGPFSVLKHFREWQTFYTYVQQNFRTIRTAELLDIPKSSVTQQLQKMQEALGPLYHMQKEQMQLTKLGHQAYVAIDAMMQTTGKCFGSEVKNRELNIGTSIELLQHWLSPMLMAYKARYPNVTLNVRHIHNIQDPLSCDFIIAPQTVFHDTRMKQVLLHTFDFYLYGSRDYLRERRSIRTLDDLSQHAIMLYQKDFHHAFDYVDSWIFNRGLSAQLDAASNVSLLLHYVLGDFGLAVLNQEFEETNPALQKVLAKRTHSTVDVYIMGEATLGKAAKVKVFYASSKVICAVKKNEKNHCDTTMIMSP